MRIVQVANFYTPTSGGLRTCLDEIGRGYLDAGHDRVLIVPGEQDADDETEAGRRITMVSPRLPGAPGYRVLVARQRVLASLDELRPDVLEVSDKLSIPWLARWAHKRGVPIVLFSHERLDAILRTRVPRWLPLPALADIANRRLSRIVDTVVVASNFSGQEFRRVGARNVSQIPLGVDLDVFRPLSTVDGSGRVNLITVGRMSSEKSPELALECLSVLRQAGVDAHLTVVGDGPLRAKLEEQAAGLPVEFTGHIAAREDLARMLAAADVALSPSSAESFGLATLEALACGTPVIVPDAGAAQELVRTDGSGAICRPTGAGLAAGVRQVLARPAEQRRAAARAVAEGYPWSATVARLLACYSELTTSAIGGGADGGRRWTWRQRGGVGDYADADRNEYSGAGKARNRRRPRHPGVEEEEPGHATRHRIRDRHRRKRHRQRTTGEAVLHQQ
jgi:alpha-1,6-mannosyltransferase